MSTTTQTPVPAPAGEDSVGTGHNDRAFGPTDYAMLEFERLRFGRPGRKRDEIFTRFAMTEVRYTQVLIWILQQPEAEAYDAELVHRLRDLEERRRAVRAHGTTAAGVETRTDVRGVRPALLGGTVR